MATLRIEDLYDKTVIAKRKVNFYKEPTDTAKQGTPWGYINAGSSGGVVFSSLNPRGGVRSDTWLMIETPIGTSQKYLYIPWNSGDWDLSNLKMQGVLTIEEQIARKEEETETITEKVEKFGKYALWGILGVVTFGIIIRNINK